MDNNTVIEILEDIKKDYKQKKRDIEHQIKIYSDSEIFSGNVEKVLYELNLKQKGFEQIIEALEITIKTQKQLPDTNSRHFDSLYGIYDDEFEDLKPEDIE